MVKKILITGSNGFVGKNLIEYYSDKYSIITLFRNDNIDDKLAENPDFIINTAASIYDFDTMFDGHIVPIQCGYQELHELPNLEKIICQFYVVKE